MAWATALVVALIGARALAEDGTPPSAGTRGTVTAWDATAPRVLEHRFCMRAGASWDYVECGARLRERVDARLCAEQGPGRHPYRVQVGEGAPAAASVVCPK